MSPEQYRLKREVMALALPEKPLSPTRTLCTVEHLANELVINGECRRTSACALCDLSGLKCQFLELFVQIHDGVSVVGRPITTLRGSGAGFAG